MGFLPRLMLCGLMMAVSFYGAFANKARPRERGWFPFLLESDNFTDWGKLWRIICLVSFLALVGVLVMKMVALLLGGPIIDLEKFR
jgi:hypothetical protein